jgi:hypothetical protein
MTEEWKLAFGREAFSQFINGLNPFKAHNSQPYDRDPECLPYYTVSREEMLNRFLAKRPHLEPFRAELADVCIELSEFSVETSGWDALAHA